ncbi:MAG: magnesium-protoporphyrin IX monomethyl ester anaerobic oxidative cyclase [Alphaproteobacteria bacterium]|nr:magnesium-protoporphyrin IX monomethyl ester anaerobic oxidative cyclase [Alphaproteobacteria bacterium]
MRILLINPPHTAIGSRVPDDHLPPLGLLSVGGPLIDAGHEVSLLDCEFGPLTLPQIRARVRAQAPDAVLIGHSGSTSAHPTVAGLTRALRADLPGLHIVYGGVFPSYHWREVLTECPWIDVVVRGEGERTATLLMNALDAGGSLYEIPGLAFLDGGRPHATPQATVVRDLDEYRVGWELIEHARYSYWGGKRAVVVQFSRGCPHPCSYCGQRGFWTRWRHRDPQRFAAEIARLHREQGVEVFNFADENPSAARKPWEAFLRALVAEEVDVTLVASTRADDIVRDADILHLYKQAGFERFLLGMENTDEATLDLIKKNGSTTTDREAIRLLRQHGILSMATWVVGFEEETDRDLLRGLKQILSYDPDQIQALYVTPHRWTPFFGHASQRRVIEPDPRKWDYKHQVLATRTMSPRRLIAWVKAIELISQARPAAIRRVLYHPDPKILHAQRWYTRMGRRVWTREVLEFLRGPALRDVGSLSEFWGAPQAAEEEALSARWERAAK